MSIKFVRGDIFEAHVEAIVNPVNCIGVMGAGLAAQFKTRFKDNFLLYAHACSRQHVRLGEMFITSTGGHTHHWIINFPTKSHFSDPSEANWIRAGLLDLVAVLDEFKVRTVAIPALGCGLGGLDWKTQVKPLMSPALDALKKTHAFVFEPL